MRGTSCCPSMWQMIWNKYPRWRSYLHDLGTFEVKHGVRVNVANLYSDEIGNPQLPSKLQAVRKHLGHVRLAKIAVLLLVFAAIVGGVFFFVLCLVLLAYCITDIRV